jgi:hypothetical protein
MFHEKLDVIVGLISLRHKKCPIITLILTNEDYDKPLTVQKYLKSGHELQMGFDTKTDWLTDRPS